MTTIPIFLICDDNYSPYMATMIASICSNTQCYIEFHVIGKGISTGNQKKIELIKEQFKNFSIDYRVFNVSEQLNIPYLILARMSHSTFIRMMLPDLYPDIDKALVMDVDMISLQDILSLWNEDLNNYIFAAALDLPLTAYNIFKKNMDVNIECKYANCGVMLIDCKKWRNKKITEQCVEVEKKYRDKLVCADQDVINKVFLGNFKQLDSRYNSTFGNEDGIINRHFCALRKPWNSKYGMEGFLIKNFEDWWKYARLTPYYDELIDGYNKFNANGDSASQTIANYKKLESKNLLNMIVKKRNHNNIVTVQNPCYSGE